MSDDGVTTIVTCDEGVSLTEVKHPGLPDAYLVQSPNVAGPTVWWSRDTALIQFDLERVLTLLQWRRTLGIDARDEPVLSVIGQTVSL